MSIDLAGVDQRIQQLQGKMSILQRQLHREKGHRAQGRGPTEVGPCRQISPPQAPFPAGPGRYTRATSEGAQGADPKVDLKVAPKVDPKVDPKIAPGGGASGAPEGDTGNGRRAFASQS